MRPPGQLPRSALNFLALIAFAHFETPFHMQTGAIAATSVLSHIGLEKVPIQAIHFSNLRLSKKSLHFGKPSVDASHMRRSQTSNDTTVKIGDIETPRSGRNSLCRTTRRRIPWRRDEKIGRHAKASPQPLHHGHAQPLLATKNLANPAWRAEDRHHVGA